jgi:multiple sugar transport system ATP-binding protein
MFVAGFIGSPQMNFIDAVLNKDSKGYILEVNEDCLYVPDNKANEALNSYIGRTMKLGIRPENINDEANFVAAHENSAINTTVEVSELMGSEVYLYLKYGENTLTARVAPTTKSRTGDKIKVALDMNNIHLKAVFKQGIAGKILNNYNYLNESPFAKNHSSIIYYMYHTAFWTRFR